MRVFEEAVEEDGEFAHDGGEGEFGGFTFFTETGVERLEDGVVPHGREGPVASYARPTKPPYIIAMIADPIEGITKHAGKQRRRTLFQNPSALMS